MSLRMNKITALIKDEISLIFLHKLQDPALGFTTITNVKVTPDLKVARVYVSVFEKENREAVLEKLNNAKGLIRSELARRVKLRHVPELTFFIDDTLDYVEKVDNLLKKIHENDNKSDGESV